MSHAKPSSQTDLMVRVETTSGVDLLGWLVTSCEHEITLDIDDTFSKVDGWRLTLPWEDVTALVDVTEFMTRSLSEAV